MKNKNNNVVLLENYDNIKDYDEVYISKVFSFTKIPIDITDSSKYSNIKYGGTGFFFDKAPDLPNDIEHFMPDYNLYNNYINNQIKNGKKEKFFKDYINYSIGFTTRGCFRKCQFCVNKKYDHVFAHSPVKEFLNENKKYIYLWDDNFLGYHKWNEILKELVETNKPFQFRQGLDLRLMTNKKAEALSNVKYHGDFIFAFDYIKDKSLIIEKLKIWKRYVSKITKLYVLCGFDRNNKYDLQFWKQDIEDTFERIKILMDYESLPYIMRFEKYNKSPYRGMYINLARWCNQPSFFKKKSFREYCECNGEKSSTMRYLNKFEKENPEIAKKYFDLKFEKFNSL